LKIAYVITRSDVMGGASVHLLDLAAGAVRVGHQAIVYVGGMGVVNVRAKEMGLQCVSLKYLVRQIDLVADFLCFFELRTHLKKFKPDIVHLHSSKAGFVGRMVAKSLNISSVFTVHGWSFTEGVTERKRKIYRAVERRMAYFVDKIITVSWYDYKLALSSGVGNSKKLVAIHNGIPEIFEDNRPLEDPPVVKFIMVARFEVPKNHKLLVDSFTQVREKNWILEFVGDGPLFEEVRSHVNRIGMSDKIIFSGSCKDVPMRIANSDVFCLISNWEGLPLTILEAMRGGLPVIASDVGGVSEAVINGETGYLVPQGNETAIVLAIRDLLTSENKRLLMGESGRRLYEQNFTFEMMLNKTIEVYQEVLASKA